MVLTYLGVIIRIFSNSYLNVFQKILTNKGQNSSVVNFYTYLGLTILCLLFFPNFAFSPELLINCLIMGLLGTLGNYFIIKALSIGDLSAIAPINSYKPIVAIFVGYFYLGEIPTLKALFGILLIIGGTYFILGSKNSVKVNRLLALIFSGTEAIFIKKVVILSGVFNSFFLWSLFGLIFATIFLLISRNKPIVKSTKYQLFLILAVGLMQYTTNFVFSKMNVSYALALFQLSTILSVFLGANIFKEKDFKTKFIGSVIMAAGAIIIILS